MAKKNTSSTPIVNVKLERRKHTLARKGQRQARAYLDCLAKGNDKGALQIMDLNRDDASEKAFLAYLTSERTERATAQGQKQIAARARRSAASHDRYLSKLRTRRHNMEELLPMLETQRTKWEMLNDENDTKTLFELRERIDSVRENLALIHTQVAKAEDKVLALREAA